MSERYLKKVEILEQEFEFITSHEIIDEVTERAALYSLQICIESGMEIVAMKVKDLGLLVEDDSTNIDKLVQEQTISKQEGALLKGFKHGEKGKRPEIAAHAYSTRPSVWMVARACRAAQHWKFTATGRLVMCAPANSRWTSSAVVFPPSPIGPMPV